MKFLIRTNGLMKMKNKGNSKKNKTFTLDFWIYLAIFIALIGGICYLPTYFTGSERYYFYKETGTIGDTIGGTMGPFVAIAAAILTFLAFWVQFKANEQQRKDIALERFESNLFELIHIQQDITNNLIFVGKKGNNNKVQAQGRDVFQYVYEDYNFGLDSKYDNTPIIVGVKTLMRYQSVNRYTDLKELGCLDHYFRHLYRVFKYINDSDVIDDTDKYKYACMVRASLSQYELIMLFYNCLSSNGNEKFKPLIETYAIFNNIRVELLARQEHKILYEEKAYQKLNDNAQS